MFQEVRSLERNKVEVFKSSLMSAVETHLEFEV